MTGSQDLRALCDLMGIQDSYQDGLGRWQSPPEASCRAFLAAMGGRHDRNGDLQAPIQAIETAEWRRPLRPVMVCRQATTDYHVPITLPVPVSRTRPSASAGNPKSSQIFDRASVGLIIG